MKPMKWAEVKKKPTKYTYDSNDYPWWLRYEGLCKCDDSFLCEHRHEYLLKAHDAELAQQRESIVEIIKQYRGESCFAADDIIKKLGGNNA